jgi:hypothetical protein
MLSDKGLIKTLAISNRFYLLYKGVVPLEPDDALIYSNNGLTNTFGQRTD